MDDDAKNTEILESLPKVDWSQSPDKVHETLKTTHGNLQQFLKGDTHGIIPIKSDRFEKILVADENNFLVDIKNSDVKTKAGPVFAIPMGRQTVLTTPGGDRYVTFSIGTDKSDDGETSYGSNILIIKNGDVSDEEKMFISEKVIDPEKLETAQIMKRTLLAQSILLTNDLQTINRNLSDNRRKESEIDELKSAAVTKVFKRSETISPLVDSYTDIPVDFGDLSFLVKGVSNGLLIIQAYKPFSIQTFTEDF